MNICILQRFVLTFLVVVVFGEYDLRGGNPVCFLVGRIALNTTLVIPDDEYVYCSTVCLVCMVFVVFRGICPERNALGVRPTRE